MDKNKKSSSSDLTFHQSGVKRMTEMFLIILFVALLYMTYDRIEAYRVYWGDGSFQELWRRFVAYFLEHIWPILKIIGAIVTLLTMYGIYYNSKRYRALIKEEQAIFGSTASFAHLIQEESAPLKNEKWEKVQALINSTNPSDWRQAIIEADIMLDELLIASSYHGETLGERLKSVEPGEFASLNDAWDAHKVRNQIAHEGSEFMLNERDAKIAISKFENVFKEFQII